MFLRKKFKTIPCSNGPCIYEYGMSDRDIEGMPFPNDANDPRKCAKFGHICPHFMKDIKLSVKDLNIRATIHCGLTAKDMIEKGTWKLEEMNDKKKQIDDLLKRHDEILQKYPVDKYPKYYTWQV